MYSSGCAGVVKLNHPRSTLLEVCLPRRISERGLKSCRVRSATKWLVLWKRWGNRWDLSPRLGLRLLSVMGAAGARSPNCWQKYKCKNINTLCIIAPIYFVKFYGPVAPSVLDFSYSNLTAVCGLAYSLCCIHTSDTHACRIKSKIADQPQYLTPLFRNFRRAAKTLSLAYSFICSSINILTVRDVSN